MEASMEVPAHRGVWHPWAPLGRSWRRFRRRPRAMQVRTALIVIAIVVGLVAWLAFAPSGSPGGAGSAGAAEPALHSSSAADAAEPGGHQHARGEQDRDQRRVPGRRHQQRSGQARLRAGQGVQRADRGDPPLREPGQQWRRDQRAQDQPDDRAVRPDERRQHAVALQRVDTGQPARLCRGRRHRDLDRGQPTLRDPAGPHPADQRLVHDDELDQPRFAVSVVDRRRHVAGAGGDGPVGPQLGPTRARQEGRRGGLGPSGRPGRAQRLPAART